MIKLAELTKGYWWIKKDGERVKMVRLTTARDESEGDDDSEELYVQQMGTDHDLTIDQLLGYGYKFIRPVEALKEDDL